MNKNISMCYPTYQYRKIINFLLLLHKQSEDSDSEDTDTEDTDYLYQIEEDNSATLIYYYGNNTDITVPKSIDGHTVKRIAVSCYDYNSNIISIKIPDGVVSID